MTEAERQQAQQELQKYMDKYDVGHCIAEVTPTVCDLCGIEPPDVCVATPIASVVDHAGKLMGGDGKTEKVLLFCPDACGEVQKQLRPDLFARVKKLAGFEFKSSCIMPSCTPVCYATIFTGTATCIHGIRKYCKPVLTVETLFDAFLKAGKKVAICAIHGCSIDSIFRERDIDYFSTPDDETAMEIGLRLIKEDKHDLVLVYMTGYDSFGHEYGHDAPESIGQLELMADRFEKLCAAFESEWGKYNRAMVVVPDHGQHRINDHESSHGEDIPEDMLVNHYYRVCRSNLKK